MELLYSGKTKDVFDIGNGTYLLKFKDDMTGTDGVFDPGANTVGLSVAGMGRIGLRLSEYFFKCIDEAGYATHFVSADIGKSEMVVLPAGIPGKGLEVICRYRAVGSFLRRYGGYVREGQALDALFEITLKDDERGDPPISKETLEMLGIISNEEYNTLKYLTKRISAIIRDELEIKGLELYDIKLEFGYYDGEFVLIDEISGGNMRVCKSGEVIGPLELARIMLD